MLPKTFRFSQSSLQDYADCPRRFQLRYVEGQPWPGVQVEPLLAHEDHMEHGQQFHRLVQRHQLGMQAAVLAAMIDGDALRAWWQAYLGFDFLHSLEGRRYPEFTLSADLPGSRVGATFDLLVVVPGERLVIFDWKTYRRSPSRQWFESRLQTHVYPYVAVRSGERLLGVDVQPEQVTMVYWVVSAPADPVIFEYSAVQFERDRAYLSDMVDEIGSRPLAGVWSLTSDVDRCRYCEYRSLCDRGERAGSLKEGVNIGDNIASGEELFGLGDVEEAGF